MRSHFPLFNTPLDLSYIFWQRIVCDNDTVIDATCGNGKDSLRLALLLQNKKNTNLFCVDIQEKAINNTKKILQEDAPSFFSHVSFFLGSHENISSITQKKCKLIVYNLGYLPGGDKTITTQSNSTIKSISSALSVLTNGGALSITCYPGHEEGKIEETAIYKLVSSLDPATWSVTSIAWNNRNASPSLLLVQKKLQF